MIVAIEGIDAAGKNVQSQWLHEFHIKQHPNLRVQRHDFPHYETTAGGVVGRILRGETIVCARDDIFAEQGYGGDSYVNTAALARRWSRDKAVIVQSVMIADRLEWMPLLVEFAQSSDNLLLLDRYKMSGVAYGAAEGLEAQWVRAIQSCLPDADLNVLLDISVEESMKRRPERRDANEKDHEKLHRARGYYLKEFAKAAESEPSSYVVLSGSGKVSDIGDSILVAISAKIDELKREQY